MPRVTGRVKFFVEGRSDETPKGTGYGFIALDDDGVEVFVHRTALGKSCEQKAKDGLVRCTLFADQHVSLEVIKGDKGPKARDVELVS